MTATHDLPAPARLYPDDVPPELPYFDDDWFRFYYVGDRPTPGVGEERIIAYEVHEIGCTRDRCTFTTRPCEFHADGCDCSSGECQR